MNNSDNTIFSRYGLNFHISNETVSDINTSNIRPYNQKLATLLDAAREVKNQDFFGGIDVFELAKDYPFVPFSYQIENVQTMLNRFEGRGVFGDQVGLGKTVETLMTAHAMFKSGAIKNALLIVPEKTRDGWKDEINEKFPGVFEIHDCTENVFADELTRLKETFHKMDNNKKIEGRVNNDVYILTDEMLKRNISALYDVLIRSNVSRYKKSISDYDKKQLNNLKTELNKINYQTPVSDFNKILEKYGYAQSSAQSFFKPLSYNALTEEILNTAVKYLEETKANVSTAKDLLYKPNQQKLVEHIDNCINKFNRFKRRLEQEYQDTLWYDLKNLLSSTVNPVANPTIDLMIIDEIHSFYESDEIVLTNPHNTLLNDHLTVTDYIALFEKKFCILLSATPIRMALEDVFNLVYLADSKRFGNNKKEAHDYFFGTICRVAPDTKYPLNEIFNSQNEAAQNNFFGLINNFFTRKRIYDVAKQMTGTADGKLMPYKEMHNGYGAGVLDLLDRDIENKLALAYRQYPLSEDTAPSEAKKHFESWKQDSCQQQGEHSTIHNIEQYVKNAVDAAIIDKLKMTGKEALTEKVQRHWAYSNVNWNIKDKCGIALYVANGDISLQDQSYLSFINGFSDSEKRAAKVIVLKDCLQKYFDSLPNSLLAVSDNLLLTSFEDNSFETKDHHEKGSIIKEIIRSFLAGVCYDATLCYLSKSINRDIRRKIGAAMAEKYSLDQSIDPNFRKHKVNYYPNASTVDVQNYNQIAIVNEKHQAGINYQHYRTFIFAQMDLNGERLLEPVDIEQWIGRIHRTGQVKDCRIVTVLTTVMTDPNKNPEDNFLKWYYEVLADPSGLDLYGNNTPDIAFLQPIIVDILRAHLNDLDQNMLIAASEQTKLRNNNDFDKFSFAELLELYFYLGEQRFVRDTVKTLCAIKEFGKAPLEN